jgi:3-oxoacyl-[acyl-carrier-protein] synthase-3
VLANLLLVSKDTISVESYLRSKNVSSDEIKKTIEATGFHSLSRLRQTNLQQLIDESGEHLLETVIPFKEKIRAIVVVSQTNDVKIPNGASILQRKLGLSEEVLSLELVDGCNGFVKALRVLDGILKIGEVGIFFGGDFNSQMVKNSETGTAALFGDGFALTVLQKKSELESMIRQDGSRGGAIRYGGLDNSLVMDGFEVFAFATRVVPKLVADFGGLSHERVDALAMHQASKLIVERISNQLGFSNSEWPVFSAGTLGNLGPASIPGWLAVAGNLPHMSRIAAIGYGSGLSWGVAILTLVALRNEVHYV